MFMLKLVKSQMSSHLDTHIGPNRRHRSPLRGREKPSRAIARANGGPVSVAHRPSKVEGRQAGCVDGDRVCHEMKGSEPMEVEPEVEFGVDGPVACH